MNQTTEQQERISLDRINTAAEVRKHAENIRKAATALAGYVVSTESDDTSTMDALSFCLGRANKLYRISCELRGLATGLDRMDETERRAAMRREFVDRIIRIIRIGEDGEEL